MLKTMILGGILGGIILFIWSSISWMMLPWHAASLNKFNNENVVAQAITSNVAKSGIYIFPSMCKDKSANANMSKGPFVFAAVHVEDNPPMWTMMIKYLIIQIIAAFFVTYLAAKAKGSSYLGRVWLVILFALAAGITCHLSYWNWFGFPTNYSLVSILDLLIGWFLAGLVIAGVTSRITRLV